MRSGYVRDEERARGGGGRGRRTGREGASTGFLEDEAARRQGLSGEPEDADREEEAEEARRKAKDGRRVEDERVEGADEDLREGEEVRWTMEEGKCIGEGEAGGREGRRGGRRKEGTVRQSSTLAVRGRNRRGAPSRYRSTRCCAAGSPECR